MNVKRFIAALAAAGAAVALYVLWAQPRETTPAATPTAATMPAAPASPAPATAPVPASAAASVAAATVPAPAAVPAPAPAAPPASQPATTGRAWRGTPQTRPAALHTIGSVQGQGPEKFLMAVQVNTLGASINTAKLTNYFVTVEDKRLYEKDPSGYEAACSQNPDKYKGHYSLLNPVMLNGKALLPMATRSMRLEAKLDGQTRVLSLDNLDQKVWTPLSVTADSVRMVYELAWSQAADWATARNDVVVRLIKTYQLKPNDYSIHVSLEVENLTGQDVRISVDQAGPTGLPRESYREDTRTVAYVKRSEDGKSLVPYRIPHQDLISGKDPRFQTLGAEAVVGTSLEKTPTLWIGVTNAYFTSILLPEITPGSPWEEQCYAAAVDEGSSSRNFLTGVQLTGVTVRPSKTAEPRVFSFDVFAGPKKRDVFTNDSNPYFRPRYRDLDYISTIDLGSCCSLGSVGWLTLGLMWLLEKLSIVTLGNYGVAIIILVALVRLVLHPLTRRSQLSMMKMQKLGPKMQQIKEKYADDKDTLQKEMMKFYKEQGASPILGCLPMFLQMPIWIALWTSLQASVELRHAAFLPVWITDLAAPDVIFSWSTPLPFVGLTSLHLLPILVAIAMFLQTLLNPQAAGAGPAATPQQAQQQKMMKYLMPGMMLFIFYNMPSGLNLYIMTSTFAGVAEQYVIKRHVQAKEALEAAMETTISIPGKGMRSARPKKPKGPFWTKRG
ncbi:MAG: YidC/Oxa1 family insertase periplasmic-domain containing protein [Planctomycetaceae bacterium]|nr:YidC/Oxa1 family insertase periplasmic-domain containing protein [Planctomycetaceae bacterium]